MVCRRINLGWIVASWAAVVAQALPAVCCGACDRACCSERADRCSPVVAEAPADAGSCPICAAGSTATAGHQAHDSTEQACRCHLKARQDQPLAPSTSSLLNLVAGDPPAVLSAAPPQAIGMSREYLAASRAVPIRPPRILFGVWRI